MFKVWPIQGKESYKMTFTCKKKKEKKARWILTRCPEHASEGTESSFLKGVTQNVGTLWLESIMQCYHWRPNVVILSRDPKRASQSGVGERQGPRADTFSNRFSESQNTSPPSHLAAKSLSTFYQRNLPLLLVIIWKPSFLKWCCPPAISAQLFHNQIYPAASW